MVPTSKPEKKPDGRLLRTERSRQLIIDALCDLVQEGVLVPTAQTVAERAGVGIRTVFRHFADMEALFATIDIQLRESYEGLYLGGDRAGSLEERIRHAIERRAAAYEKLSSLMLSTRALMWRSPVLQKNYARNQRGLRKDLAQALKELNPKFLRFPGGCIAHGSGLANLYLWKDTVGDVAERKPNWGGLKVAGSA